MHDAFVGNCSNLLCYLGGVMCESFDDKVSGVAIQRIVGEQSHATFRISSVDPLQQGWHGWPGYNKHR